MPTIYVHGSPIDVLMVDDNPGDIRLAQEAFGETGGIKLHAASDGLEAMSFLRRKGPYASSPRPDLVLLDLQMPRMNGPETLAQIRADEVLGRMPVVILTSSNEETDIAKCRDLNANLYLTKPEGFETIAILVKTINDFAGLGQCRV